MANQIAEQGKVSTDTPGSCHKACNSHKMLHSSGFTECTAAVAALSALIGLPSLSPFAQQPRDVSDVAFVMLRASILLYL